MPLRLSAILIVVLACACAQERSPAASSSDVGGPESADAGGGPPPAPSAAPRGLPQGALHVQPAAIVDYTGFEQPMAAATLFVPSGWRTQGGVEWGQQHMCTNGYAFNWSAVSPDGTMSMAVLPQHGWSMSNYGTPPSPGCQHEPHTNVRQYLESVVQRLRPGVRAIDFRVREDLQREFAQQLTTGVTPMPLGEIRQWVEAGELLFTFDEQGRALRGAVAAVVYFSLMRTNGGFGPMDALTASAFPAWAVAAPEGQLNHAFFEALRRSLKADPRWQQRITGHNTAIARSALEENRKRAQIIAQSNEEIARIRQDAWNAYQESSDRRAREFGEVIRGVETYRDPNAPGGTVELSHMYDHAWRLNDGSYVLTNDPSFDPWRYLNVEGSRLDPVP